MRVVIKGGNSTREFDSKDVGVLFYKKNRYLLPSFVTENIYPNLTSVELIRRGKQIYFQLRKRNGEDKKVSLLFCAPYKSISISHVSD